MSSRIFLFSSLCACLCLHRVQAQLFDPIHYGAIGDGKHDDTTAIRAAMAAVAANKGGVVLFDTKYTFLTGCFNLTSNLILTIKGTILATQNPSGYVPPAGGGTICAGLLQSLKTASNITINGGGLIDGQGEPWWTCACVGTTQNYPCNGKRRPTLLKFEQATDIHIYDLNLKDSPAWTTSFSKCTNVHINNVRITAPSSMGSPPISHNTDGFDIDSCSNVLLENSYYSGGDDSIALGSGPGHVLENVLIRNMTIGTSHGLSIGSKTSGDARNITFKDITCNGSDAGVKIKTQRGNGGLVQDITYTNIRLYNVRIAIWFTFNYVQNLPPEVQSNTPQMKNINVNNIFSDGAQIGWLLDGLPESVIVNAAFSNITLVNTGTLVNQCDYVVGSCSNVMPSCPACLQ